MEMASVLTSTPPRIVRQPPKELPYKPQVIKLTHQPWEEMFPEIYAEFIANPEVAAAFER